MTIRNFNLSGVSTELQLGKGGPRVVNNSGNFSFRNSDNTADVNITVAIGRFANGTTSLPSISFTSDTDTGIANLNPNEISLIANSTVIARIQDPGTTSSSVIFEGNASITVPRGTTAQRPSTPVNGMIRYNDSLNRFEYYVNGSWEQILDSSSSSSSSNIGSTLYEFVSLR